MKRAQRWARLIARLTRGAVPVDGFMLPTDIDVREKGEAVKAKRRPRDSHTTESEFNVAIYPRWGNFR
jgi:hypothetical protein